ncbi:MAG: dTMP kinase [Synergistaceae bacterium]|jgi:dTMP kinase|nr:dTMP kinase [Synergistaceae bacterium]
MFIVLEGIDGSGKTTQAARLGEWLSGLLGRERVLVTKEPGGWLGGDAVRRLALGGGLSSVWGEFFLFMMDRCEHVSGVVMPALEKGMCVICDRYTPSTLAYQVLSNPLIGSEAAEYMTGMSEVIGLPRPDCACLLDIDADTARRRLETRGKLNSFDARGRDYFERVRAAYDALIKRFPDEWIKVDASEDENTVFGGLKRGMERMFGTRLGGHAT